MRKTTRRVEALRSFWCLRTRSNCTDFKVCRTNSQIFSPAQEALHVYLCWTASQHLFVFKCPWEFSHSPAQRDETPVGRRQERPKIKHYLTTIRRDSLTLEQEDVIEADRAIMMRALRDTTTRQGCWSPAPYIRSHLQPALAIKEMIDLVSSLDEGDHFCQSNGTSFAIMREDHAGNSTVEVRGIRDKELLWRRKLEGPTDAFGSFLSRTYMMVWKVANAAGREGCDVYDSIQLIAGLQERRDTHRDTSPKQRL